VEWSCVGRGKLKQTEQEAPCSNYAGSEGEGGGGGGGGTVMLCFMSQILFLFCMCGVWLVWVCRGVVWWVWWVWWV